MRDGRGEWPFSAANASAVPSKRGTSGSDAEERAGEGGMGGLAGVGVGEAAAGAAAVSKARLSFSQLLAAALRMADLTRSRAMPGKDGRGGAITEAT